MLSQLRERLQLDRALAIVLATRIWQAISGPITIVLLIRTMTLAEQGVYYAIIGVIGIQAYFELGLLNVLVSHAGHEAAAMAQAEQHEDAEQRDKSWTHAAARMRDLVAATVRWFSVASILYLLCAIAFGWYSLEASQVDWQGPLLALVPLAAVTVFLAPLLSILEGAGNRDLVYRCRLGQMMLGSLVVWTTLAMGWKLWALVAATLVQVVVGLVVAFGIKRDFFVRLRQLPIKESDFAWWQDVVPVQWRMALISAAYHFATQFFVVIVVMFHSDVEAGPLGMTLSVTSAIQMLAMAWVQTKYPLVAMHHGSGQREQAGTMWRHTAVVSTGMLMVAFVTLIALVAALPLLQLGVERRFLNPSQILLLLGGCLANHLVALQSFYVLSRRAKPLLGASLTGSLTTAAAVWGGGYYEGADGVLAGYAVAMILVFLPLHSWAYAKFRKRAV